MQRRPSSRISMTRPARSSSADAATQLAVERIDRGLAQGMAVDVVDGAAEGLRVEDSAPDFLSIVLQPVIGAETGAGRAAQLSADLPFVAGDALRGLADERIVVLMAGQGGRVGPTMGGAQDFELALGYAATVAVEPDEGVVVVGGAQVDEHAVGPRRARSGWPWRSGRRRASLRSPS